MPLFPLLSLVLRGWVSPAELIWGRAYGLTTGACDVCWWEVAAHNPAVPAALFAVAVLIAIIIIIHTTATGEAVALCSACGARTMHYKAASSITCLRNMMHSI
jgi:hypothetical protein